MKNIIIEDEKSALDYIETVLSDWDAWKSHHVLLVQALEVLLKSHQKLTIENEKLGQLICEKIVTIIEFDKTIEKLTDKVADCGAIIEQYQKQFEDCYEENERLHASYTELTQECKKWQSRLEIECEYTRADTVRKMKERVIAEFRKDGRMNYYIRMTLDQIEKEMLEETK